MKLNKEVKYSVDNNYIIDYEPLSKFINVDKFQDGNSIYLVNIKDKEKQTGFYNFEKTITKKAITNKKTLDFLLENPQKYESILNTNRLEAPIYLVKKGYTDYFKNNGFNNNLNESMGIPRKEAKEFLDLPLDKNLLDLATSNDYEFIQFVNEKSGRFILNKDGELFIEPIILDYIAAGLHNQKYYLDDFIELLIKRNDVAFITHAESRYDTSEILKAPLTGNEKACSNIIANIPGYNAEEDKNEYILLVFYPNAKDTHTLKNWKLEKNAKDCFSMEDFIVKEMLNGKDVLKKKIIDEKVEPKRKFKV